METRSMKKHDKAKYAIAIGLLVICGLFLAYSFIHLENYMSHVITSLPYRVAADLAIVLVFVPLIIAVAAWLHSGKDHNVITRVVYLKETQVDISVNAGSPALYLKAFISSMDDRKGNALKVARELRDAVEEAIRRADATKKAIKLTSPLLDKPSVQSWLKRKGFTPIKQFPWTQNLFTWWFFWPIIAPISLFTGNKHFGRWQTWTRE